MLIGFKLPTVAEPRLYLATERTFLGTLKFSLYSSSFSLALDKLTYFAKVTQKLSMAKQFAASALVFAFGGVLLSAISVLIFLYYIKQIDGGEKVSKKEVVDPRIYMAAERTFLAWVRTAISITVFGFVIDKFEFFLMQIQQVLHLHFTVEHQKLFQIGSFLIVMGVITILLGITNFQRTIKQVDSGFYRTNVFLYTTYGILIFLVCLIVAFYVLELV